MGSADGEGVGVMKIVTLVVSYIALYAWVVWMLGSDEFALAVGSFMGATFALLFVAALSEGADL